MELKPKVIFVTEPFVGFKIELIDEGFTPVIVRHQEIFPCFNVEKLDKECVQSAIKQTIQKYEDWLEEKKRLDSVREADAKEFIDKVESFKKELSQDFIVE